MNSKLLCELKQFSRIDLLDAFIEAIEKLENDIPKNTDEYSFIELYTEVQRRLEYYHMYKGLEK